MHKTLIITILFISSNLAAQSPKVSTAQGSVIGYTESGINIFKAIPFASPGLATRYVLSFLPVPCSESQNHSLAGQKNSSPLRAHSVKTASTSMSGPNRMAKRNLSSCGSMAEALIPVQQLVRSMRESIMRSRVSYL